MMRTVEIALIPVFQFGVFSDSDLGFFSSPQLDFAGRVHTNGDLYLGVSGTATLTFHDKITAYGNVVRNQLPNGLAPSSSYNNDGDGEDSIRQHRLRQTPLHPHRLPNHCYERGQCSGRPQFGAKLHHLAQSLQKHI